MEKIPQNPSKGKVFLQAIVLTLLFVQTYYLISFYPYFSSGTQQAFEHFFVQSDDIYDVTGSLMAINNTVQTYYLITHIAVGNFSHITDDQGITVPMTMLVTSYDEQYNLGTQKYFLTNKSPFGPFVGTDQELNKMFDNLFSMSLVFSLTCSEFILGDKAVEIQLDVVILYVTVGGTMMPKITITRSYLNEVVLEEEGWLGMITLVLAVFSVILSIRRIFIGFKIYTRCKERFKKIPDNLLLGYFQRRRIQPVCLKWEDIPLKVKIQFLASWDMFSVFGDLSIIFASALHVATDFGNPASVLSRLFTGVGLLILCVNMTRYLEYNLSFYTLIVTLRVSVKNIASFVISAVPTFMGFLLCGWVVFSPYSTQFLDINTTAINLFGLMNGDSVHDAFGDVDVMPFSGFSRFYMYTFVFFFTNVALKIFFIIIEQAYNLAKVLTTDRSVPSKVSLDHNEILLWESLQQAFSMGTLFELLELPDVELRRQMPQDTSSSSSGSLLGTPMMATPPLDLFGQSTVLDNTILDPILSLSVAPTQPLVSQMGGLEPEQVLDIVEQHQKHFLEEMEGELKYYQHKLIESLSKELPKIK